MPHAPFDLSGAVTFDLSVGRVHVKDAPARLLVPAEALSSLCEAAGHDATRSFGHALGMSMGQRLAQRLLGSQAPEQPASVPEFIDQLGAEVALMGLGALGLERWGRAMVLVLDHAPLSSAVLGAVLEGAVQAATGRVCRCVPLMQAETRMRFLVAHESMAEQVAQWLAQGMSWGEVLVKLHAGQESPQARGAL